MKTGLLIFFLCASALGQSVKLAWNPSTSSGVTNYTIYAGTNGPGNYSTKISTGTNCAVLISNMVPGQYWFAATAQIATGAESPFSNEVTWVIPQPPANLYTVILNFGTVPDAVTNQAGFFRVQIVPP